MKMTSKTIVFFGSGPVAAASLRSLFDNFEIEAVITKAVPAHHKESAPVETLAKELDLNLFFANTKQKLDELMSSQNFKSPLGLIVDFGVIVSEKTIAAFPLGIVNSHFSLLPQWRGADPITFAILSGQTKTGVSLMLIEPTLDTGKLLVQKSLPIQPDDTIHSLTNRLVEFSNELLIEYLPRYMAGEIRPLRQSHPDRATYSRLLTKQDGIIDWTKPAEVIEREIRAFAGWPGSRTTLAGKDVIITKAYATPTQPPQALDIVSQIGAIGIVTGKGTLWVQQLKPAGKKEMSATAFLAGYRQFL